jgi:secernin
MMCDTIVANGDATMDGVTIFAKNSDREPNEAQYLEYVPAADHNEGSTVQCTYIEIPQVAHTNAVLLSRPFWMWGAEMGANEHGVAIGNEAVFTRIPYTKGEALLGMDLLRLGLERAQTAYEALQVITTLIAAYGQGGNCGFQHALYYHNSYIIADPNDAWVLETAGPHWAAKQIRGYYTISNCITLGNDFDLASEELVSTAVKKGWCKGRDDFDFARNYSDFIYTTFADGRGRCSRTSAYLSERQGKIDVETAIATLRHHRVGEWRPDQGLSGADVCMHAGFGPVRVSQSVGSMVSYLQPDQITHFFTATAAPCTSIFKPVWFEAGLPDLGPAPDGVYDSGTMFWQHETLHRLTLLEYPDRISRYQQARDELEKGFITQALQLRTESAEKRYEFSTHCFHEAEEAEAAWLQDLESLPDKDSNSALYRLAWRNFNRQAQMPF